MSDLDERVYNLESMQRIQVPNSPVYSDAGIEYDDQLGEDIVGIDEESAQAEYGETFKFPSMDAHYSGGDMTQQEIDYLISKYSIVLQDTAVAKQGDQLDHYLNEISGVFEAGNVQRGDVRRRLLFRYKRRLYMVKGYSVPAQYVVSKTACMLLMNGLRAPLDEILRAANCSGGTGDIFTNLILTHHPALCLFARAVANEIQLDTHIDTATYTARSDKQMLQKTRNQLLKAMLVELRIHYQIPSSRD
jgi:hypothetical protein